MLTCLGQVSFCVAVATLHPPPIQHYEYSALLVGLICKYYIMWDTLHIFFLQGEGVNCTTFGCSILLKVGAESWLLIDFRIAIISSSLVLDGSHFSIPLCPDLSACVIKIFCTLYLDVTPCGLNIYETPLDAFLI